MDTQVQDFYSQFLATVLANGHAAPVAALQRCLGQLRLPRGVTGSTMELQAELAARVDAMTLSFEEDIAGDRHYYLLQRTPSASGALLLADPCPAPIWLDTAKPVGPERPAKA